MPVLLLVLLLGDSEGRFVVDCVVALIVVGDGDVVVLMDVVEGGRYFCGVVDDVGIEFVTGRCVVGRPDVLLLLLLLLLDDTVGFGGCV